MSVENATSPPPAHHGCKITPLWVLKNFEEIISCAGLVVIIAVVSVNVMLRYIFSSSIAWAEEVSVIGFSCVIFIGSAAVYKRNMHVGIDFIIGFLPGVLKKAVFYFTKVFMLVFTAFVAYLGWIYSVAAWERPTSILFIPYFFVDIPICIGFASMAVYSAIDFARLFARRGAAAEEGKPA